MCLYTSDDLVKKMCSVLSYQQNSLYFDTRITEGRQQTDHIDGNINSYIFEQVKIVQFSEVYYYLLYD